MFNFQGSHYILARLNIFVLFYVFKNRGVLQMLGTFHSADISTGFSVLVIKQKYNKIN
jgi:hypothetical protein